LIGENKSSTIYYFGFHFIIDILGIFVWAVEQYLGRDLGSSYIFGLGYQEIEIRSQEAKGVEFLFVLFKGL
jgi:hypothetical protein